jgi:hypothetical protein
VGGELAAALDYARAGTPVHPCRPRGKLPLTAHGVQDATVDPQQIERWWGRWPDANVGLATGAPGPTVLDVDNPQRFREEFDVGLLNEIPTAATARGFHYYFRGLERGTIKLSFGELRGRGSYVVAPPSIHETGRVYVWLLAPHGLLPRLISRLAELAADPRGSGEHLPPPRPIAAGDGRHPYMIDFAIRLIRAGVVDRDRLLLHLKTEFGTACEADPPPAPQFFTQIVNWALGSRIAGAEHERQNIDTLGYLQQRQARHIGA